MNKFMKLAVIALTALATTSANADNTGSLIGTIVGGVVGNKLCKGQGNGQAACAVAGAVAGAYVGNEVTRLPETYVRTATVYGDDRAQPQNYREPARNYSYNQQRFTESRAPQCTEYQQVAVTPNGDRIAVISCACKQDGQYRQAQPEMCQ